MKKRLLAAIIAISIFSIIGISAKSGGFEDQRVNYIYWDQEEINTYWTGVSNKVNYDNYAPCVGVINAGYECGAIAYQNQYKEFSLPVYVNHLHGLQRSTGSLEYIIK